MGTIFDTRRSNQRPAMVLPSYTPDLSGERYIHWLSLASEDDPALQSLTDLQILEALKYQHIFPLVPLPARFSTISIASSSDAILHSVQPLSRGNILHRCKIATLRNLDERQVEGKGKGVALAGESDKPERRELKIRGPFLTLGDEIEGWEIGGRTYSGIFVREAYEDH